MCTPPSTALPPDTTPSAVRDRLLLFDGSGAEVSLTVVGQYNYSSQQDLGSDRGIEGPSGRRGNRLYDGFQ